MQQPTGDSSAPVDRVLLRTLEAVGPTAPTVAAVRCPLSVDAPRPRFEELAERDLVERVSPEPVYRVTDDGEQLLAAGSGTAQSATGD